MNNKTETEYNDADPFRILRDTKIKNVNRLVISHLNINSIRNKFEPLKNIIKGNLDILVLTETKIDESFTNQEFRIDGYTSIRLDRDIHGGVLVYAREDIPYREIRYHTSTRDLEEVTLEINLRKSKWLLFGVYNHTKLNIDLFLNLLAPIIETHMGRLYNFREFQL